MKTDDSSNYVTATYTDDDSVTHKNQKVWKYGGEHWCNMKGRYTTIVADLSHLSGPYEMSLCNAAIMGTKYEPDSTSLTKINVLQDVESTLKMYKVKAVHNMKNTLAIRFRQKNPPGLDWVTIPDGGDDYSNLKITASSAKVG